MSNIIEWSKPPVDTRGRPPVWKAIAEELKQRPGEWALVKKGVSPSTGLAECQKFGLERVTRVTSPGSKKCNVWARYPA